MVDVRDNSSPKIRYLMKIYSAYLRPRNASKLVPIKFGLEVVHSSPSTPPRGNKSN